MLSFLAQVISFMSQFFASLCIVCPHSLSCHFHFPSLRVQVAHPVPLCLIRLLPLRSHALLMLLPYYSLMLPCQAHVTPLMPLFISTVTHPKSTLLAYVALILHSSLRLLPPCPHSLLRLPVNRIYVNLHKLPML
jgi:hypothetical protein